MLILVFLKKDRSNYISKFRLVIKGETMVNIALIGMGYWGRNHFRALRTLQKNGDLDKILVCDSNPRILKELKKLDNIYLETNWKKVVMNKDFDLVDIVVPTPLHYKISREMMLAGKDVLVEKPLSLTSVECDNLIKVSNETGRGLMVGHIFRYHTAVNELRNRIMEGFFGDILYITIRRQSLRIPRKDMGVMLALGVHEVDLHSYLLGDIEPDSIFADINFFFGRKDDMAFIIQKFGNIKAYSIESWVDPSRGKLRELTLVGRKGSAMIDFSVPEKIQIINEYINPNDNLDSREIIREGSFTVSLEPKEPLLEEIKHFIEKSLSDKQYSSNAQVGKRSIVMLEKAFRSSIEGKYINL